MPKAKSPVKQLDSDWRSQSLLTLPNLSSRLMPGGMVLPQPTAPVVTQSPGIAITQPQIPSKFAMFKRGALSGWGEPYNMSTTLDAQRIQSAIRSAERGDTWQLFTIYRDMEVGYSHLQTEFAKRKLTVVGQPHAVLPRTKDNKDDEKAVKVINEMIDHCDNWNDALSNMLDSVLWPATVCEKLFSPVEKSDLIDYEFPIRYRLRKLDPVNPTLFCYKIPYMASGFGGAYATAIGSSIHDLSPQTIPAGPMVPMWDPNSWEPDLRFYEVFENGYPNFSPASTYAPERARHMIHRGSDLTKAIRDNFGGPMRAILFWWFLATQARDWFGRYMQRWGHPFLLGKVDAQQKDTLQFMRSAISMSMEIGGLVIDKNAEAQLLQAASLNGAEGYRVFLELCNDEVSKIVVGQTLSATAKSTGLGSGVAKLHSEVRSDLRQSDMRKLSTTLTTQLFNQYLRINGYSGHVKGIIWGGKDEGQTKLLAETMKDFGDAGIEASDEGLEVISERVGFSLQRMPMELRAPQTGNSFGNNNKPQKSKKKSANKREAVNA